MLIIGLLLAAATAAFVASLIAFNLSGGPDFAVTLFGSQPFTISTLGAFLGGLALALIFGAGLWLMLGGAALFAHRRKKRRLTRHRAQDAVAERDALQEQLHHEHRDQAARDAGHRGSTSEPRPERDREGGLGAASGRGSEGSTPEREPEHAGRHHERRLHVHWH